MKTDDETRDGKYNLGTGFRGLILSGKPNLIVVFGAGASHGCFVNGISGEITPPTNHPFIPPLASQIFRKQKETQDIALLYPGVQSLVGLFDGESVEQFLSEVRASCEQDSICRMRYFSALFYLRKLLTECTRNYLNFSIDSYLPAIASNAYTILVDQIYKHRDNFGKVVLISLNYDLLLDLSLSQCFSTRIDSLQNYAEFGVEKWIYLKPHGSINWGRRYKNKRDLLKEMTNLQDLEPIVEEEPELIPLQNLFTSLTYTVDRMFLPSLAPPTGTYKSFILKTQQVALENHIFGRPAKLLTIGFGGMDKDIFKLIGGWNLPIIGATIVDPLNTAASRVDKGLSKLGGYSLEAIVDSKFEGFVSSLSGGTRGGPGRKPQSALLDFLQQS